MMQNAWKVIWWEAGKKYVRTFEGDKPSESGAIAYGKHLQSRGIVPNLSSKRKAFAPTQNKLRAPEPGMLWCPYCLKWKNFVERALQGGDGLTVPIAWRCPICTISINSPYVKMYNREGVARLESRKMRLPSEKLIRRATRSKK